LYDIHAGLLDRHDGPICRVEHHLKPTESGNADCSSSSFLPLCSAGMAGIDVGQAISASLRGFN